MNININKKSRIPLYLQISAEIERYINDGILQDGERLPSERTLASSLGVHRNTVVKAYGDLISKGIVSSSRKHPMGYFIRRPFKWEFPKRLYPQERSIIYKVEDYEKLFSDLYWVTDDAIRSYMAGLIMDRSIGPFPDYIRSAHRIFEDQTADWVKSFIKETEILKSNICKLLSQRNIHVPSSKIQLVAETNQAVSYLINLYLKAGDAVIVEEPIVPDVWSLFVNKGIKIIPVPMEFDGINLTRLEEAIIKNDPKFIYTIPTCHNPTGITMSLDKRNSLLEMAHKHNVIIIEDDYMSQFLYDGKYPPSMFCLDKYDQVIYLDSFTLTFPYPLKIGYMVGSEKLISQLGIIISMDETYLGNIGAYILNDYIDQGYYDRHLILLRSNYRNKMNYATRELDRLKEKGVSYIRPKGGMILWCSLRHDIDGAEVYRRCLENGLAYYPGWVFFPTWDKGYNNFRLCFSKVSEEELSLGVKILEKVLDSLR